MRKNPGNKKEFFFKTLKIAAYHNFTSLKKILFYNFTVATSLTLMKVS